MKKKGFTLVELLVVIAILAILAIVATPRILDIFNDAKKNAFLIDVKGLYKAATQKYISESLKGNNVTVFSSDGPNKLDLDNDNLEYYIVMDDNGKVTYIDVTNGEYNIQTNKKSSEITENEVSENPIDIGKRPKDIKKMASTTSYIVKTNFNNFVNSNKPSKIVFSIDGHNDGTNISNDANEPIYAWMDGTIMYVSAKNANTKVSLPEDSSNLFARVKDIDASYVDTSKVKNMNNIFSSAFSATGEISIDLSNWNTSNVENIESAFFYSFQSASKITINLSGWDTSKINSFSNMFAILGIEAEEINIVGLGTWNTSNITNINNMFMSFGPEAKIINIDGMNNWDTSNIKEASNTFAMCGPNVENFELNLSNWETPKILDMNGMFSQAGENSSSFKLDISKMNTLRVASGGGALSSAGKNATTWEIKIKNNGKNTLTDFVIPQCFECNHTCDENCKDTLPSGRTFTLVD